MDARMRVLIVVLSLVLVAGCGSSSAPASSSPTIGSTAPSNPQSVFGGITDADTGKPIAAVEYSVGLVSDSNGHWVSGFSLSTSKGRYEIPLAKIRQLTTKLQAKAGPNAACSLKFRAEGYVDEQSKTFSLDKPVPLDIKLRKWPVPKGTVLNPNGTPAAQTRVRFLNDSARAYLETGGVEKGTYDRDLTTTDSKGRFQFNVRSNATRVSIFSRLLMREGPETVFMTEPYTVFIIGEKGYAHVGEDVFAKKDASITLTPWARVTGRVMKGTEPAADETVAISSTRHDTPGSGTYIFPEYRTKTDSEGRFTFERVPAGKWRIARIIPTPRMPGTVLLSHNAPLDLEPGKTADVLIGGGRAVTGKVELPETILNDPKLLCVSVALELDMPMPHDPDGLEKWPEADRQAWHAKWNDELWPEYVRQRPIYLCVVEDDGRFRIDGVPPGKYQWHLTLHTERGTTGTGEFCPAIPAAADGSADEPFDIGVIRLHDTMVKHFEEQQAKGAQ